MKKYFMILLLIATSGFASGQKPGYEKYIISNLDWKETASTKWEETIKTNKGSLYYFGALHLDNPADQQFAAIKKRWDEFKPTVAFYEGPDRGVALSDTLTIRKFGESGYVRFLAKEAGLKTIGLEPSPVALYTYLCSRFSQEQVDLYMLTKEAMRLRTRKGMPKERIEIELNKLIELFSKMLGKELAISNLSVLEASFKKNFGSELNWWEAPVSWFDPQLNDQRFTNQLALLSTGYRDIYMVEVLAKHINNGERVFAVIGRNHVPLQINAIRYAVDLPIEP